MRPPRFLLRFIFWTLDLNTVLDEWARLRAENRELREELSFWRRAAQKLAWQVGIRTQYRDETPRA